MMMPTSDPRIFHLTLAIHIEIASLFVSIDYLSTCCKGGIIKHSTGLARSDTGMAKHRETDREKQADRGAVKHLTCCQPQGGLSWNLPHSIKLLQKMSMLQIKQLDRRRTQRSGGNARTHTQRNSFVHAMSTSIQAYTHICTANL